MKLPSERNDPMICYDGSGVWHHAFIVSLHRCCASQTRPRSEAGRGTCDGCVIARHPSLTAPQAFWVILKTFMTYDFAPRH